MSAKTKHIYAIELTDEQVLEVAELHVQLRELGDLPENSNLGMFMRNIFYRGFNEYKKELVRLDC